MVTSRRSDLVCRHVTGWVGPDSLVFGERPNGTILHISEVYSGLACNCTCPGCKAPLVARKGDLKDHHFGHYGTAETPACQTGAETALHKFAKECLARRLELFLPAIERQVGIAARAKYLGGMFRFDAALLEHRLANIVPDVIVHKGERDLFVEFRVSHPCDTAKIAKIAALNVAAVEIDLSYLPRDVTRPSLEEAIITQAPRRWLYNPKSRANIGEEGTQQKASVAKHRFASLVRAYRDAHTEVRAMRPTSLAADRIGSYGLSRAIGVEVPGLGCFAVSTQDWQAAVLEQALDRAVVVNKPVITIADALHQLRQRSWVSHRFARIAALDIAELKAIEPLFASPAEAISVWAAELTRLGILLPAGAADRWIIWPEVVRAAQDARSDRTAIGQTRNRV